MRVIITAGLVLVSCATAGDKHNWQTGTVVSFDTKTKYVEHHGEGHGLLTTMIANRTTSMADTQTVISGREYRYRVIDRKKHFCRFIVGDDVKYEQKKSKLYVLDADGKQCTLEIVRQERIPQQTVNPQ